MIWIVEECVFQEELVELQEVAATLGVELRPLSIDREAAGRYGPLPGDVPVVFRGSFEAAEAFRQRCPNVWPGIILTEDELRCSGYFPKFGTHLLNDSHSLLELKHLHGEWDELRLKFRADRLFIRPDSGTKSFSGQVVEDPELFLRRESAYLSDKPHIPVIVAPVQEIEAEYRLVVVDGKVASASQYRRAGRKAISHGAPDELLNWVAPIVATVNLALAYVLDVAIVSSGRFGIVEMNSFNSADFYACDRAAIVTAVLEALTNQG